MTFKAFLMVLVATAWIVTGCGEDDDKKDNEREFILIPVIPQFAAVEEDKYATGKCWPMGLNAVRNGEEIGVDRDYEATIGKTDSAFAKEKKDKVATFDIFADSKCKKKTETVLIPKHETLSSGRVYIKAETPGMAWFNIRVEGDSWVTKGVMRKEFVSPDEA